MERELAAKRQDGMEIRKCLKCGHQAVSYLNFLEKEIYDDPNYFEGLSDYGYDSYEGNDIGHWTEELFASAMLLKGTTNATLLDIGCATGTFLDHCKAIGIKTSGIELSTWAAKKCGSKGHQVLSCNLNEIDQTFSIDLITAFHVLEHIAELPEFVTAIAEKIGKRGKFFAIFPLVDLSEENWNGCSDSFEHISYFEPEFIELNVKPIFKCPFHVIVGSDQIYCFAGDLDEKTIQVLNLCRYYLQDTLTLDLENSKQKLSQLSTEEILFLVNFIAKNHSASRASSIAEAIKEAIFEKDDGADYLELSYAIMSMQNGNLYGCATHLSKISTSVPTLLYFRDSLLQILSAKLKNQVITDYPKIAIFHCCTKDSPAGGEFFHSIGSQTYPYLEIYHIRSDETCFCKVPKEYQPLVKEIKLDSRDRSSDWASFFEDVSADYILWTDGSLMLSPFCLFALLFELQNNDTELVVSKTQSGIKMHITKLIDSFHLAKLFGFSIPIPPMILSSKETAMRSLIDPTSIRNQKGRKNLIRSHKSSFSKDVLAWTAPG